MTEPFNGSLTQHAQRFCPFKQQHTAFKPMFLTTDKEDEMTAIRLFYSRNSHTLAKTATYYVMHITVAAAVAYAVTRNWSTAIALSLLEPTVQAFAFFAHEKTWQKFLR